MYQAEEEKYVRRFLIYLQSITVNQAIRNNPYQWQYLVYKLLFL